MDLRILAMNKNDGQAVWFMNSLVIVKVTGAQTNNSFGLIEMINQVGLGSPYHVHHGEDEMFYVLEGELEFVSGSQRTIGGPGTTVVLPRGIPHGYRVVGTSPARFLVLTTPGGFEGFFIEAGRPAPSLTLPEQAPPDMAKLKSLADKYHMEILGPLPE